MINRHPQTSHQGHHRRTEAPSATKILEEPTSGQTHQRQSPAGLGYRLVIHHTASWTTAEPTAVAVAEAAAITDLRAMPPSAESLFVCLSDFVVAMGVTVLPKSGCSIDS